MLSSLHAEDHDCKVQPPALCRNLAERLMRCSSALHANLQGSFLMSFCGMDPHTAEG